MEHQNRKNTFREHKENFVTNKGTPPPPPPPPLASSWEAVNPHASRSEGASFSPGQTESQIIASWYFHLVTPFSQGFTQWPPVLQEQNSSFNEKHLRPSEQTFY